MGKKDKKKGMGKEKTAAKTEKKAAQRLKKELKAKGEEDIEELIKSFIKEDEKKLAITETLAEQPSRRSGFTLCAHPHKDQLLLFGGEFFNGGRTYMYNDLFIYNIKKSNWTQVTNNNCPPPRTAHQAITVAQNGGEMWIFGGEFASPTQSQFYHYKDLWVYRMETKQWEAIKAPGGPSSRSGHRMVVCNKNIFVFGGFHSRTNTFKYFNDVHIFDMETYQWTELKINGTGPSPRSACMMVATTDNKIAIYGGFTQEKSKKDDDDKSIVHTDLYLLFQDVKKGGQWKWQLVRQPGLKPFPRCAFSMVQTTSNKPLLFGGVHDVEEDEDDDDEDDQLAGIFHNDLHQLDITQGLWTQLTLKEKSGEKKSRRKVKQNGEEEEEEVVEEDKVAEEIEEMSLKEDETSVFEGDVFKVTLGPSTSNQEAGVSKVSTEENKDTFWPHPRMKASLVVKNGILYLYGGMIEEGDKQLTLTDFYTLDLHKLNEWKTLIPMDTESQEWLMSSDSEEDDEDMEEDDGEENSDLDEEEGR